MVEKKKASFKWTLYVFALKKKDRNQNDVITVCVPRHAH